MNINKTFILILLSLFLIHPSLAQDKTIVGKVGKDKITYGELKEQFNYGVKRDSTTLEDLKSFLPTYLDYRAKVKAARELGYFEDETVLNEYGQYSTQAAYAFWLEEEIKPTRFDEYYERANTELRAEHVLISLEQNASALDTLKAYNELLKALDDYKAGMSFAELNEKYSSRRNGRTMGGELPWFSVGVTVKDFEDVAFSLDVDEVSMPFRTRFGYHVLKVNERRPRTPARLISHIFRRDLPSDTSNMQKKKMDEAYQALIEGRSWSEVVKEYSEDNLSLSQAGSIGWISYASRYNISFIDQIMNLSTDIDITGPIRTVYGYHIFKMDSIQTYNSEGEKREKLFAEFEKTPYFVKNNRTVIYFIRENSREQIDIDLLKRFKEVYKRADSTIVPEVIVPEELLDETFYTIDILNQGQELAFTLRDLQQHILANRSNFAGRAYADVWVNAFYADEIEKRLVDLSVERFPEFRAQLDRYKEGLAVFKITDENVWSASTVDSTKLMEIFEQNMEDYQLEEREYYHLISVKKDSSLTPVMDFINEGNHPDSIRSYMSYVAVTSDSTNTFDGEPFDRLKNMDPGSFSDEFEYKRRKAVFYLNERLPARSMTFEEAFGRLLATYQPEREKEWLSKLRKKYKVKTDSKKLEKAFKQEQSL